MLDAKPTNRKPVTDHGKRSERDFKNITTMHNVNLTEVDNMLTEKEMSLKKKIFSLPKMEALVHPDPKLSAVYNKMAEDGEEKYGYHYNETIMNIIFNDYVLNSPKYLQKYKMAVPKKKKRRDKSGIRQLQKAAEKKIKQAKKDDAEKSDVNEDIGGIRVQFLVHPNDSDVFAYFPDENHDSSGRYKIGYSHIGQHSAVDPQYAAESRPATPEEYEDLKNELEQHVGYSLDVIQEDAYSDAGVPAKGQKPMVHGGEIVDTGSGEGLSGTDKKLRTAKTKTVDTVTEPPKAPKPHASVTDMDETTTTGGVGGTGMGSGGYATPFAWGGGDLSKGTRKQKPPLRKPIWKGGTIIQESEYLIKPDGFEKFYKMLNESIDFDVDNIVNNVINEYGNKGAGLEQAKAQAKKISSEEGVVQHVNQVSDDNYMVSDWYDADTTVCSFENGMEMNEQIEKLNERTDDFIRTEEELKSFFNRYRERTGENPKAFQYLGMIRDNAMYSVAIHIANKMLGHFTWDELPDTNSMWDYIDYKGGMTEKDFLAAIKDAVNDRLAQSDMGIEGLDDLSEEAKSKAQQRFMGAVRGVQKGDIAPKDVSPKVRKTAKQMKKSDVKDFASTKHDDLPEKVDEHHLDDRESQINFMNKIFDEMSDEEIHKLYRDAENILMDRGVDPVQFDVDETVVNEYHIDTTDSYKLAEFIIVGTLYAQGKEMPDSGLLRLMVGDMQRKNSLGALNRKYKIVEKTLGEEKITKVDAIIAGLNEETDQTMISGNPESMANKPRPEGEFGGGVPMGMQDSGGLGESEVELDDIDLDVDDDEQDPHKIDWKRVKSVEDKPVQKDKFDYGDDKIFEELNEELEAFSIHQNKLKNMSENRKPSALVLKDRLGKDNIANFKKDMKDSATKDVVKMEKDMTWKDQQEKVGDNPYKMGEDLEKEAIKRTKGNALENVGNSDGTKGEIPKRNLRKEEQDEVDEYRLGQQDLVYDNVPDEKFEERMKAGMGDELYEKRQKKLEKRSDYPMYNKERQPVQDAAVEKVEFNKQKSGWNERAGLKESVLAGKYFNELNKKKIIDFKLSDVKIVESVENMFPIDFTGMGNSIDSRGNVNEAVNHLIIGHKFYTDGKNVVATKNPVQKLDENVNKDDKPQVNEEFNKMKHLLGYKPQDFVSTKNIKI